MGVDYTAHYGLGVQISNKHKLVGEDKDFECMQDWLEENLNEKYRSFETGEGDYTGEDNDFYVCLSGDLACGIENLQAEKEKLLAHLKELDIEVLSDFDVVGGLQVW